MPKFRPTTDRCLLKIISKLAMLFFVLLLMMGCDQQQPQQQAPKASAPNAPAGVILAVGDSLTAGYGLDPDKAYPALLEKRLAKAGYHFKVINAGISGETSSGTRSRLSWTMSLKPDIVILETGANDGLRGIDPALIEANLTAIIEELKANGVIVVLAGMQMVYNLGLNYRRAFNGVYPAVARAQDVILMPFFLKDVAGVSKLNLSDGIHPNAKGYKKVVGNLWPYVIDAINQKNKAAS